MIIMLNVKKLLLATATLIGFVGSSFAEISPDLTTANYAEADAKISPNGKYLAIAVVNDGRRTVSILDTKKFKPVGGINFGEWQDAGNFFWVSDKRLVAEVLHRQEWDNTPKYFGELYAIDYNGKNREMIYGYRAGETQTGSSVKKKDDIYGWGKVINTLPNDKRHILISSTLVPDGSAIMNSRNRLDEINVHDIKKLTSTVHRLNIENGKIYRSITRSPVSNAKFYTTEEGELTFVTGLNNSGKNALYQYVDSDWKFVNLPGENTTTVGFDKAMENVYYLAGDEEAHCLSIYNVKTSETIKDDTMCYTEAPVVALTADNRSIYGIRGSAEESFDFVSQDSQEAAFLASIQELFKGQDIDITSSSEDGEYYVVKARDTQNNLAFYLYSAETNQFNRLI